MAAKKQKFDCDGCGEPLGNRLGRKVLCVHCIDPKACQHEPRRELIAEWWEVRPPATEESAQDIVERYGDSTPRLLRFVYGNTEPMEAAHDGDFLDFTRARPPGPGPIIESRVPRKQQKKLDELMKRLRQEYQATRSASTAFPDGPQDAAYFEGTPEEERLPSGDAYAERRATKADAARTRGDHKYLRLIHVRRYKVVR